MLDALSDIVQTESFEEDSDHGLLLSRQQQKQYRTLLRALMHDGFDQQSEFRDDFEHHIFENREHFLTRFTVTFLYESGYAFCSALIAYDDDRKDMYSGLFQISDALDKCLELHRQKIRDAMSSQGDFLDLR